MKAECKFPFVLDVLTVILAGFAGIVSGVLLVEGILDHFSVQACIIQAFCVVFSALLLCATLSAKLRKLIVVWFGFFGVALGTGLFLVFFGALVGGPFGFDNGLHASQAVAGGSCILLGGVYMVYHCVAGNNQVETQPLLR